MTKNISFTLFTFLFFILTNSAQAYDVLVLAHPIIDRNCQIDNATLKLLQLEKGECILIDHNKLDEYISKYFQNDNKALAGSAINVVKGLTKLNNNCAVIGTVGADPLGQWIAENTKTLGISFIHNKVQLPTSQCLCFITPDKERTMLTYSGASFHISEELLDTKHFENLKFFHLEGYQILKEEVAQAALEMAKKHHATISIDLATPNLVRAKKEQFLYLIKNYANIVFCNESEAIAISDLEDPVEACGWIASHCDIAIVTQGEKGGVLHTKGNTIFFQSNKTDVKDTTGAGDLFTSGFIDAYLKGESLEKCLIAGRDLASKVIAVYGVDIPDQEWEKIKKNSL